jgi:tetratricopeptide (TPR) repeat protein
LNDLNGRANFGLSRVLYARGNSAEALMEITRAEQTYADSHEEVLRGRILEQMGNNDEAVKAYRHSLVLDPTLSTPQGDIDRLNRKHLMSLMPRRSMTVVFGLARTGTLYGRLPPLDGPFDSAPIERRCRKACRIQGRLYFCSFRIFHIVPEKIISCEAGGTVHASSIL